MRNRTYRRIYDAENAEANRDDIPDVYQQNSASRPDTSPPSS
jgi:NhaA family Na+:H+ antiporter